MRCFWLFLVALTASCATSSKTYLPDGREGYVVQCSGSAVGWGDCEAKAGNLCGPNGYEVESRTTGEATEFTGNRTVERSMMIVCNGPKVPSTTEKVIEKSQEVFDTGVEKGQELLEEGGDLLDQGVDKVKGLF